MPLEYLDMIAPITACTIIISIHVMLMKAPQVIKRDHHLEHKCIVCAYFIFMFHYLLPLVSPVS